MAMDYHFEPLAARDRKPVIDTFNYYIENSFAAYPEKKVDYDFFDIILTMTKGYPAISVKTGAGEFMGFAFLHAYHPMPAFKRTAQITYFLNPDCTGAGIGKAILGRLINKAKQLSINSLLANISSLNERSIDFHLKNGFTECGRFKKIGRKHGRYFDVVWMQKMV